MRRAAVRADEAGRRRLLFVDDDPKAGSLMRRFCEGTAFECVVHDDPRAALADFEREGADLVVTDLRMPGMDGIELVRRIRARDEEVPVIIITAYSTLDDAIEALRLGAADFIKKPFDMEELLLVAERALERTRLRRENRLLRRQLREARGHAGMIGRSEAIRRVQAVVDKVAAVRCPVLIQGESGTGKELVARALHERSPWAERPFVVVDCGALTETLLESELFGHEKGAFTGADRTRRGLLESADGGTVFLDEIGNVSPALQAKLLRVVQEGEITRVGGVRPIRIDVRFVAATHRDLEAMVRAGEFRHDLYHRLNVVRIALPPLRERREDIPLLVRHFVETFARRYGRRVEGFDADSMRRLMAYHWPGNVRELRNVVERHVALADGPVLRLEAIEPAPEPPARPGAGGEAPPLDADMPTLEELERRYILKVLERCGGSRERTAAVLGINKSTLWRRLQRYGGGGAGGGRR